MTSHTFITIIGVTTETGQFIFSSLAELDIQIMLIAKTAAEHGRINEIITSVKPKARVEIQECAREGCWEGDIIILAAPMEEIANIGPHIKDVMTQKTVVSFAVESKGVEKLLPHSRIVKARVEDGGFNLESMHGDALSDVEELFQSAGLGLQTAYSFTKK